MKSRLICGMLPLVAAGLSSCFLPYPHRSYYSDGIQGEVLDAQTGKGIARATLKLTDHSKDEIQMISSHTGRFHDDGGYYQQWAIFIGPTILSFPHTGSFLKGPAPVVTEITHPSYQTWKPDARHQPELKKGTNLYWLTPK